MLRRIGGLCCAVGLVGLVVLSGRVVSEEPSDNPFGESKQSKRPFEHERAKLLSESESQHIWDVAVLFNRKFWCFHSSRIFGLNKWTKQT